MALGVALMKWLSLASNSVSELTIPQVSDGVIMAEVLTKIDPKHFTQDWMSKLKHDAGDNKRLKANNLRKIINTMSEYMSDVIGIQVVDFPIPDSARAAEGYTEDISRILQLILGCAVNCDHKQEYIESIMGMDADSQQLIMQAIQEILNLPPVTDPSLPPLSASEIRRIMDDLQDAKFEKDQLMQKCHDLEIEVRLLQEEKNNLASEFEHFQKEVSDKGNIVSMKYDKNSDARQKEVMKILESAQEVEKERDELQLKVELLDRQLEEMTTREGELQKLADQARALKDEVDILRDASDKVVKYEAAIESYKKKLDEFGDLKRQMKLLEENNMSLLQANLTLENDVKKTGNWKPQIEVFKKQNAEYLSRLETESKRADKLEFESKKLLEQLEAVKIERDRLQTERDELRESNIELADQLKMGNTTKLTGSTLDDDEDLGMAMIPLEVKEKLLRLKIENKKLKEQISSEHITGQAEALQAMIEELTERNSVLEASKRKANQRIMELESQVEEAKSGQAASPPRIPGSREELELKLSEANKKISTLQDHVQMKEVEMQAMEERYKRYIEKAKSVIKTLDPKQNPHALPEISALRKQLTDKDVLIESLEQESDKARAIRDMEERLITSAFYNLSMHMHRATVENRLSNIQTSGGHHQGQSFLSRQRQMQSRPGQPNSSAKNYSDFMDY